MRLLHRHLLGRESRGEIGVLIGEHLEATAAARCDDAIAVTCGGAKHLVRVAGHIDGQRLLHWARCDVGLGHLVVTAVVFKEILFECQFQDLQELVGHRDLVFYVDAETLELIGLIAGPDAEHQTAAGHGIGGGDLRDQPHWIVERHDDDCSA